MIAADLKRPGNYGVKFCFLFIQLSLSLSDYNYDGIHCLFREFSI